MQHTWHMKVVLVSTQIWWYAWHLLIMSCMRVARSKQEVWICNLILKCTGKSIDSEDYTDDMLKIICEALEACCKWRQNWPGMIFSLSREQWCKKYALRKIPIKAMSFPNHDMSKELFAREVDNYTSKEKCAKLLREGSFLAGSDLKGSQYLATIPLCLYTSFFGKHNISDSVGGGPELLVWGDVCEYLE